MRVECTVIGLRTKPIASIRKASQRWPRLETWCLVALERVSPRVAIWNKLFPCPHPLCSHAVLFVHTH